VILARCGVDPIGTIGGGVDACGEALASAEDSGTVSVSEQLLVLLLVQAQL